MNESFAVSLQTKNQTFGVLSSIGSRLLGFYIYNLCLLLYNFRRS